MKKLEDTLSTCENTFIEFEENCKYAPTDYQILNVKNLCTLCNIHFQDGGIKDVGLNGIFMEDLLNIVRHRLLEFQKTIFACDMNAEAISGIEVAINALRDRTNDRKIRGVQGTYEV